jgi:cytochrome P450
MATAPTIDISSMEFWAKPWEERLDAFKWLRDNDPVSWHRAPDPLAPGLDNSKGYWAITRYDDMREISRQPEVFSSAEGVFVDDFPALETILSFIVMDPPKHTQLRGIVQSAFSPRNIKRMEQQIRDEVTQLVAEFSDRGEAELCEVMFIELPGRLFAGFVGVEDRKSREILMEAAEQLGAWADPKYAHIGPPLAVFQDAAQKIMEIATSEGAKRREQPGDDLLTWIIQAEFEGEKMSEAEVGAFFTLLVGAANDTTRHSMAHAVRTLQEHPDQKAYLLEDFEGRIDNAVEELLRWKPPLLHFRRTAVSDYEIQGKTIKAGDKVVLWYVSGNYDERAYDNPNTFDITRTPNMHLAFGAGGPHYCMGNALGRQMIKSSLRELFTQMPDLEVGEPEPLLSNFMNGVITIHGKWTPPK